MIDPRVVVAPASADAFTDVEHALTGGGDGASCWCRWLMETRAVFDASSQDGRRAALQEELDAAEVAHAVDHGARVIEGYPVDRAERPKATSAELWHGTVGLFARAGFTETGRSVPARPVMTLRASE